MYKYSTYIQIWRIHITLILVKRDNDPNFCKRGKMLTMKWDREKGRVVLEALKTKRKKLRWLHSFSCVCPFITICTCSSKTSFPASRYIILQTYRIGTYNVYDHWTYSLILYNVVGNDSERKYVGEKSKVNQ